MDMFDRIWIMSGTEIMGDHWMNKINDFVSRDIRLFLPFTTLTPLHLDRYRDDRWREEKSRDHGYDRDFRDRGELRIRVSRKRRYLAGKARLYS